VTALGAAAGRARLAKVGAAVMLAAAALERWTIFRGGSVSAADPRYVVGP
jgi:hypothetical protein